MTDKPSASGVKTLKYNVMYPSGNEQEYFPMMEMGAFGSKTVTELSVVLDGAKEDRKIGKKHVSTYTFVSPPGLGKTTMGAWLARIFDCPYQTVNCVSTMTDLDLLGSQVLMDKETMWQYGPLPSIVLAAKDHAVTHPDAEINGILIVNEFNALTQNAQLAFNPLLDWQECLVLVQNNNELVKVDANSHIIVLLTMNEEVMGVHPVQTAVRDRSSAIINMDYPSVDKEAWLVSKITGINEEIIRPFVECIDACRRLKTIDHTITQAPSIRGLLDWIRYTTCWGAKVAFDVCVANKYGTTTEERLALKSIASGKKVESFSLRLPTVSSSAAKKPVAPIKSEGTPAKSPIKAKAPKGDSDDLSDLGKLWKDK